MRRETDFGARTAEHMRSVFLAEVELHPVAEWRSGGIMARTNRVALPVKVERNGVLGDICLEYALELVESNGSRVVPEYN